MDSTVCVICCGHYSSNYLLGNSLHTFAHSCLLSFEDSTEDFGDGFPRPSLAPQGLALDTGTFKSSTSSIILYLCRLCARLDNYVTMMVAYDSGTHETLRGRPLQSIKCPPWQAFTKYKVQKKPSAAGLYKT